MSKVLSPKGLSDLKKSGVGFFLRVKSFGSKGCSQTYRSKAEILYIRSKVLGPKAPLPLYKSELAKVEFLAQILVDRKTFKNGHFSTKE